MAAALKYTRLAEKILDVAVESGLREGDRLVEKSLAESCSVSRTPVRAALRLLMDRGLARRAEEGGTVLACAPESGLAALAGEAPPPADLPARILRDRAARRLDDSVNVTDLLRRYGCTRAEAQKALETLLAQGVMQRAEGQLWLFQRMPGDRGASDESYDFRLMLEPQAILSPAFRLDATRAAAVRTRTEALLAHPEHGIDPGDFQQADLSFHRLIARSAGNQFVTESLMAHHGLRQLSGPAGGYNDFRMRQALEEHLRMLDHIEAGQPDLAADLMRVHLRLSRARRPSVANRGAPALAFGARRRH